MSENIPAKNQRGFLIAWSGLNLLGWIIGIFFVVLVQLSLEDYFGFSALRTFLVWLPLGASIGIFQWLKLKHIGIDMLAWVFTTAVGGSILATFFSWVENFSSFEYRGYDIPYWVINTGSALAMPIGGAIIGSLQSFILRKSISRLDLWIRAYVLGLAYLAIAAVLGILFKSALLNILYFFLGFFTNFGFWVFFIDMRWFLFFGFLFLTTALLLSFLTGKILLMQSNIDSVTITTGYRLTAVSRDKQQKD